MEEISTWIPTRSPAFPLWPIMGRNLTSKNQASCSTEMFGVHSLDQSLSRAPAAPHPCGFEGSAAPHPRLCSKTHPYMCFLCTDLTVPQQMCGEPVLAGQVRKTAELPSAGALPTWGSESLLWKGHPPMQALCCLAHRPWETK